MAVVCEMRSEPLADTAIVGEDQPIPWWLLRLLGDGPRWIACLPFDRIQEVVVGLVEGRRTLECPTQSRIVLLWVKPATLVPPRVCRQAHAPTASPVNPLPVNGMAPHIQ